MNSRIPSDRLRDREPAGPTLQGPLGHTSLEIEEAAAAEGLWPVTEAHWKVIQYVRAYCRGGFGPPPLVRVARATGYRLTQLEGLFPSGTVTTVLRLTGLDLPTSTTPACPHRVPLSRHN